MDQALAIFEPVSTASSAPLVSYGTQTPFLWLDCFVNFVAVGATTGLPTEARIARVVKNPLAAVLCNGPRGIGMTEDPPGKHAFIFSVGTPLKNDEWLHIGDKGHKGRVVPASLWTHTTREAVHGKKTPAGATREEEAALQKREAQLLAKGIHPINRCALLADTEKNDSKSFGLEHAPQPEHDLDVHPRA